MLNGTTPEIQHRKWGPKSLFTETTMLLSIEMPNNFVLERFSQMIRSLKCLPKLFEKLNFNLQTFLVTLWCLFKWKWCGTNQFSLWIGCCCWSSNQWTNQRRLFESSSDFGRPCGWKTVSYSINAFCGLSNHRRNRFVIFEKFYMDMA